MECRILPVFLGLMLVSAASEAQPVTSAATPAAESTEQTRTMPGALRQYATIHSIGIEWDLQGDSNHNAVCKASYRVKGGPDWKEALPLFRVDYAWFYGKDKAKERKNMLAGSIMFLKPGTEYEVKLDVSDPDGGAESRTSVIRTRPIPELPKGGRTLHVVPGAGGGTGTEKDPFRGIASAEAAAQPGDTLLLHAGAYGEAALRKAGAENGKYVVWKAAGDGEVVFDTVKIGGSYIWVEGLTLKRAARPNGITADGPVVGAVVTRNTVTGFHYCILLSRQCRDWYIADNVLVGDKEWPADKEKDKHTLSGEGIELAESIGGHVVCYNSISRVADGFSYPGHDTDVYGNDIFDVTDDATETDRGWANVRVWGNRCTNFSNAGLSFQPMNCGPWYFIRNQFVGSSYKDNEIRSPEIFKFRVQDRFVLVNNTFVSPKMMGVYMDALFTSLCRNNLYISSADAKPLWAAFRYKKKDGTMDAAEYVLPFQQPGWKTDVDYDGFDWGQDCKSWKEPAFRFDWCSDVQKCYFTDIESMSKTLGIEQHGLRVRKEEIFEKWEIPGGLGRVAPHNLTLKRDCKAVDAGAALPNLCEGFTGTAPDLGACEAGQPPPHYGPRDGKALAEHAEYWVLRK